MNNAGGKRHARKGGLGEVQASGETNSVGISTGGELQSTVSPIKLFRKL